MSKAQLEKFIGVVSNDPALLRDASGGEEDLQKCARNVAQYAKAQGYDFTEEEAEAWLVEQSQTLAGGELKDSQLDAVAGGGGPIVVRAWSGPGDAAGGSLLPAVQHGTGGGAGLGGYDLKPGSKMGLKH